ncbi:MAG: cation transporter, partial [Bacteroidetes bacterium]
MAAAGWITFDLTGSQAMLLDGNFSFVLALATFIAIFIPKNKHKKSNTFPFGNYVYEAAFVLSKGLLILGIVITAFFQNSLKIFDFFQGEKGEPVPMTPIYYYTVFILILTLALMGFFKNQNKK